MRIKIAWLVVVLCWIAIGWLGYEFVTHIQPGALDCTIAMGQECR